MKKHKFSLILSLSVFPTHILVAIQFSIKDSLKLAGNIKSQKPFFNHKCGVFFDDLDNSFKILIETFFARYFLPHSFLFS